MKRAEANPKLLPTRPISVPKVRAADVHLTYRGEKIIGKSVPFDSIDATLDIDDGRIRLSPLRLGMDGGSLRGSIDLLPVGDEVDANADITAENINIGRLLASAGLGSGQGSIDGTATVKGRGASLSGVLGARRRGMVHAVMVKGGNVNSLLVDLLTASNWRVRSSRRSVFRKGGGDPLRRRRLLRLRRGTLASRRLEVNTTDHVITGGGRIDLAREVMEMTLRTGKP